MLIKFPYLISRLLPSLGQLLELSTLNSLLTTSYSYLSNPTSISLTTRSTLDLATRSVFWHTRLTFCS